MYVTVFAATQELSDSNTLVSENDSQQNKTMQLRQLALPNPSLNMLFVPVMCII